MMGMGAGMMPGMAGMMGMKAAKKDPDKKKASGRMMIEDKVKRGEPRERDRKREKEGVPETGTTTPPPPPAPPLQRPAGVTPVQPKTAPSAIGPGSDAWKQKQNRQAMID